MVDNRKINAGLYIRVSTDRQVKEGYSISAQKENLINYAKSKDWNIFDIYADEGISAKNIENRPEIKRLISDIKNKKIDVVVLYKFDRLTRDISDTEDIIKLIQNFGIEVHKISGGIVDVSTAVGRFQVRIEGAVAQLEREQTVERVKLAFVQKVKEGKSLCCGVTSYGYDRPKYQEIQTVNKKEALIVKRIFKMYIDGKTFTEIADILNAERIPTKKYGRTQKKRLKNERYVINSVWQAKTIKLILSNVSYIGGVRYGIGKKNGFEIMNGLHEPIITMKQWNIVQEKLNKSKKIKTRYKMSKEEVYFSGVLKCGLCGQVLTTQQTKRKKADESEHIYYGYRCLQREKKLCAALGMSHKKVEEVFLKYIENISDLTEIENMVPQVEDDNDELVNLQSLENRIQEIEKKKQEVMFLFMNNSIDSYQLKYMTDELNKNSTILDNELKQCLKKYQPIKEIDKNMIARSIKSHWEFLCKKERREFLLEFVESITIVNRKLNSGKTGLEILDVKFYD